MPKRRKGAGFPAKPGARPAPRSITDVTGLPDGPRVVCPFPPIALSPNARGHWSKRSRAAAAYRRECWALALAAGLTSAVIAGHVGPIGVQLDFFPPNRNRRDDDNAQAAFKSGRDGIADALKVDDARFAVTVRMHSDPRGCVVATLLIDRGRAVSA